MAESAGHAPSFYEFFAGGGMVRAGLGPGWTCLFANDFDPRKGSAYQANWGSGGELTVGDVRALRSSQLPGRPDLVWGSFPCQDLSLAGAGAGLDGERSGTFYPFWSLIKGLALEGRPPALVAVENVCGALTSRRGADFEAICRAFAEAGYRFGPLVINADRFLPQSRPRLFVVGVHDSQGVPPSLRLAAPTPPFHSDPLRRAADALPAAVRARLIWWNLPAPAQPTAGLTAVLEDEPHGVRWHRMEETARLLALMSPVNLAKVRDAQVRGARLAGCVYRRTRLEDGLRVQRAEVRFDDLAGCLRTPAGGSSRQAVLVVEGDRVRSRLLSPRETARLMGLADSYVLPRSANEAYHLTGDGVAVPVVRHLAQHILEPLVAAGSAQRRAA
jgi:DNA (cytosine-5)-methyltransferase 1